MPPQINHTILMSGADFFDDYSAINPYMDASVSIDIDKAHEEHESIKAALKEAGVEVIQVKPPVKCQDGIYTANWALVRGQTAVLSRLPNARKSEEPYAEQILRDLGKTVVRVPGDLRFSGQGDSLPCGNYLFAGSVYRTDKEAHQFVASQLGYEVITLQTVPHLDSQCKTIINKYSGWPDSFFYDIDLALAVIRGPSDDKKGLIAWCPEAFTIKSREKLNEFTAVDKIEVSLYEAHETFACNLVSTGEVVIMSAHAPQLKAALEAQGLRTITPEISELTKGGGYIRCTTLTLDD